MSLTTEVYSKLSRLVYRVDKKYPKYNSAIIEGETIKIGDLKYEIIKLENNTTNGMQAMAVAPVENGKVDTSEIVIAYAGTNPSDSLDIMTDIQNVIGGNKDELNTSLPWQSAEYVDSQIITAEIFAENVLKNYPDAEISTTGHSLGEYIALYIAAENGWKNVGFNGPDPYKILSQEAKDWIEANPGMLYNFRNDRDIIGNFGGNGTGAEIRVDMDMGMKEILDSHALSVWTFDEDGNLIIEDTKENQEALQILAEKQMYERMHALGALAVKIEKIRLGRGGISSGEQIFLNNTHALITVEYASQSMKIALQHLISIYKNAITEAKDIWENGIQSAYAVAEDLTYSEIITTLASMGVTRSIIVDTPVSHYKSKIATAQEVGDEFDRLATEIKASIEELEQSDHDVANHIRQGA